MNEKARMIRALLSEMSPKRAIEYVKAFELPQDEELYIIERDIHKKSIVKIADENHTSTETVWRRRQSAYKKIAQDMDITRASL